MKTTDEELIETLWAALDALHIVCETGPLDIRHWYLTDDFAKVARDMAIDALNDARRNAATASQPSNGQTIAEMDQNDAERQADARIAMIMRKRPESPKNYDWKKLK